MTFPLPGGNPMVYCIGCTREADGYWNGEAGPYCYVCFNAGVPMTHRSPEGPAPQPDFAAARGMVELCMNMEGFETQGDFVCRTLDAAEAELSALRSAPPSGIPTELAEIGAEVKAEIDAEWAAICARNLLLGPGVRVKLSNSVRYPDRLGTVRSSVSRIGNVSVRWDGRTSDTRIAGEFLRVVDASAPRTPTEEALDAAVKASIDHIRSRPGGTISVREQISDELEAAYRAQFGPQGGNPDAIKTCITCRRLASRLWRPFRLWRDSTALGWRACLMTPTITRISGRMLPRKSSRTIPELRPREGTPHE